MIFGIVLMGWKWKLLSFVWLFATHRLEFSRKEYWSGQLFPSPGELSNPGIEPRSPALQTDSLPVEPPGKPKTLASWWSRRTCAHLLLWKLQNYNSMNYNICLLLNNHQQENFGSHKKKDTLHSRAKEKTKQDGRRGEIEFRIKPHTCQRLRGLKQNLVHTRTQRPHRHCARPVFESPAEVWVSSGLPQGQGRWVQLPGSHSLCINPLGGGHH